MAVYRRVQVQYAQHSKPVVYRTVLVQWLIHCAACRWAVRHKVRAPSYTNVPTFKASCIGLQIPDVAITLASVDPCYSCTERMCSVVDADTHKPMYTFDELIRLSHLKTRRMQKEW